MPNQKGRVASVTHKRPLPTMTKVLMASPDGMLSLDRADAIERCRTMARNGKTLDDLLEVFDDEEVIDEAVSPGSNWDGERWHQFS